MKTNQPEGKAIFDVVKLMQVFVNQLEERTVDPPVESDDRSNSQEEDVQKFKVLTPDQELKITKVFDLHDVSILHAEQLSKILEMRNKPLYFLNKESWIIILTVFLPELNDLIIVKLATNLAIVI